MTSYERGELEYRKDIQLSSETEYWFVDLGRRDNINGPGSYPFPTEFGAFRFAASHKRRDPHRDISVRCPDGAVVPITLPELGDPDGPEESVQAAEEV